MRLSCGGRGPCCHIGYAHRHCEHCDVVIPTQHSHWPYWWQAYYGSIGGGTYYGNSGLLSSQLQQLQTYGASVVVETSDHTHEEAT